MGVSSLEAERCVERLSPVIVRMGSDPERAAAERPRLDLAGLDQAAPDALAAKGGVCEKVMQVHAARPELKLDQAAEGRVSDQPGARFGDQNRNPSRLAEEVPRQIIRCQRRVSP